MSVIGESAGDFWVQSGDLTCADFYGSIMAIGTQNSDVWLIDLATGGYPTNGFVSHVSSLTSTPNCIKFISSTVLAVAYNSNATPTRIDLTTGTKTNNGSANMSCGSKRNRGMAADIANSLCVYVSDNGTNYSKLLTTGSTFATTITPSWAAGNLLGCLLVPGTSHFLFWSKSGTIKESSLDGATLYKTITLPSSVSDGSIGRLMSPDTCSMDGDNLYVITTEGCLLHYTYSTSTLNSIHYLGNSYSVSSASTAPIFGIGDVVNGLMPVHTVVPGFSPNYVSLWDVSTTPIMCVDEVFVDTNSFDPFCAINETVGKLAVTWDGGRVSLFDVPSYTAGTEDTRLQDPAGSDATGRIIRMPYFRKGLTRVEADQSITAGINTIDALREDEDYMEIGLEGTPFSTEAASVRMFQP